MGRLIAAHLVKLLLLCTLVSCTAHGNTRSAAAINAGGTFIAPGVSMLQVSQNKTLDVSEKRSQRIPEQLILTGKWASIKELPGPVGRNVQKTIALNPELRVRWLSDSGCHDYLTKYFDQELVDIFSGERRGSFRGDICRAAVLSREGGFYTDLDVEWVVPMRELIDESTTFMSATGQGAKEVLNAVMAAEPGNKIIEATLRELRNWYRLQENGQDHGWMGPVTLREALEDVQRESCPDLDLTEHILKRTCGPHNLRLYEQRSLNCNRRGLLKLNVRESKACPPNRAKKQFDGLQYGLFEPGDDGKLIGWPRFAECTEWGCGGGGWSVNHAK